MAVWQFGRQAWWNSAHLKLDVPSVLLATSFLMKLSIPSYSLPFTTGLSKTHVETMLRSFGYMLRAIVAT